MTPRGTHGDVIRITDSLRATAEAKAGNGGMTMKNATKDAKTKAVQVRPHDSEAKLYKDSPGMNKRIATRAYEIFERRGKMPGHDLDDWLKAEAEVVWELH